MELTFDQHTVRVDIVARRPGLRISIDGHDPHDVEIEEDSTDERGFEIAWNGLIYCGFRFITPSGIWIHLFGRTFFCEREALGRATSATRSSLDVRADMPGTVVSVHVREGAHVTEGDPLVTIESMKLQLTVNADHEGEIARVHVASGATFDRGATLVTFHPPKERA